MRRPAPHLLGAASVTVGLLVLLALGATSRLGALASPGEVPPPRPGQVSISAPPRSAGPPGEPDQSRLGFPSWLGQALRVLVIAVVIAVVVLVVLRVIRAMREREILARATDAAAHDIRALDEFPEFVDAVTESLAASLQRLRLGDNLDEVILECWRRLEDAAADTGVPRAPSQTAAEFTVQMIASTRAAPADLAALADVYRQAMFSRIPTSASDRDRAVDALEHLVEALAPTGGAPQ